MPAQGAFLHCLAYRVQTKRRSLRTLTDRGSPRTRPRVPLRGDHRNRQKSILNESCLGWDAVESGGVNVRRGAPIPPRSVRLYAAIPESSGEPELQMAAILFHRREFR